MGLPSLKHAHTVRAWLYFTYPQRICTLLRKKGHLWKGTKPKTTQFQKGLGRGYGPLSTKSIVKCHKMFIKFIFKIKMLQKKKLE